MPTDNPVAGDILSEKGTIYRRALALSFHHLKRDPVHTHDERADASYGRCVFC